VIDKRSFSPLTGSEEGYSYMTEDEGARPSNAAESSGHSPVSGDDQESPEIETAQMSQEVLTASSEYPPASDAEPDVQAENMLVEVKIETRAEDLLLAQAAQALARRQSTT
jgi:hypothetical protein